MRDTPARRAFAGASAASLGVAIGQIVEFPESHWAAITALTLLRPGQESTGGRTVLRVLSTGAAALFVVGLYGWGDPEPRWIIPSALTVIGVCYYLMHFTAARYALVLFSITAGGFALIALDEPLTAPGLVGYRAFHITVGSILVFVMCTLFRFRDPGNPAQDATPPGVALEHSLRVILACALGMVLAAVIERPEYGGAIVITICVLGARMDFAGSVQVGAQRFGGALLGGALALVYFIFILNWATSIWSLMLLVFCVSWFCCLLLGVPRLSYLGYQVGFVFIWGVGDPRAPTGDLWVPLERMAQVLMGSAVLLFVYALPLRIFGARWGFRAPAPSPAASDR